MPNEILEKLKSLENKICVGGENLIEKAELQQQMIAEREAELQLRRNKEIELREALELRQREILKMEDSYGSLQEEVNALNKKIKKVWIICFAGIPLMFDWLSGLLLLERRQKRVE